ncbi:hypothetical protein COT07_00705 [Candidatus Woesearchaeota archaeon CG07_land_8_20_14_0_80_44_23]|nr:MAG: hypothetical protein COT07_00705 [Candidatus Woesearchaeota archaeon CG07_land_8_20_14_0_80_44_23]
MKHIKSRGKAQVWSLDFIVAVVFFAIALTMYFKYAGSIFNEDELDLEGLRIEAASISSGLLTPGYPQNWNESTVSRIGISDDGNNINPEKLQNFLALSSDYERTKKLFSVTNDFYILLRSNSTIIAQAGVNKSANLIATAEKIVLYNSTLSRLSVYSFGT